MTPLTVVTGGGRGIGAATVRQLAAAGHDVVFCYRRDADAADAVLRDVTAAGRRGMALRADTTDPDQVVRLFDEAAKLGEPTGLVNNAGVTSPIGPFEELTVTDLRRVVDVNLIGYVLCAQQAARRFPSGGAIVNVSSAAATLGSPGEYVHYAAVKAATDTLTVGLAKELAPRNIRVNAVSPGIIDTEIHTISGVPDRAQRVAGRVPLGRAGRADEVAAAIVWLLGDGASYTTGAVLRVAGGM
ncbi:SDR family oxidoreductase [Plantactinospora veratri]|uniref:SDR family oxidoreductase n=1 Tax=Plantactinospora veratri TaxID=1436122 RepID=A0ABU7SPJ8_9ACTN